MNTNNRNNRNNRNTGNNSNSRNDRNNRNIVNNNTSGVSFDSLYRGYSVPHSHFDDEFNMDFEYGYLNLMANMHTFIRRAQTVYSRMETRISSIIDTQTERRRNIEWDRSRTTSNSHEAQNGNESAGSPNSYANTVSNNSINVEEDDNDNQDNDDDDHDDENDNDNDDNIMEDYIPIHQEPSNIRVNIPNQAGSNDSTNTRNIRNVDVFDFISVVPRTMPLRMNTLNRTGGISIHEIEENSEIIIYSSIPSSDVLNTECPISLTPFQPNSLVLRLNSCRHCFVPFRIMNWFETQSTCPLCRGNVISSRSITGGDNRENRENRENIENNIENTTNVVPPNNPQINELDISNNEVDISNIYNRLINNNIFNGLSIEERNNNSIVFSFDVPENQENNINNTNYRNSYIYPRLERLFSSYNMLGTNANNNNNNNNNNTNNNSNTNNTNNTNNNNENNDNNNNTTNHYDEVD